MDELISEYGGMIVIIILGLGIIKVLSSAIPIIENMF